MANLTLPANWGSMSPEQQQAWVASQLPSGWESYTPQQKIAWFNANNVSPEELEAVGTPESDIKWMQSQGYTAEASGGDIYNGVTLPKGWEDYSPQQKINFFNDPTNKITEEKLLQAGVNQSDIDWMEGQGFKGYTEPTTATTTTIPASQSTLSPNFSPYVYNMLAKGEAAANLPFQPFTGQRFAETSPLYQQSFQGLSNLQLPTEFRAGSQLAALAGLSAGQLGNYAPGRFANFYQSPRTYGPGEFGNFYQAPTMYGPGEFGNFYQPQEPYQGTEFQSLYSAPRTYAPAGEKQFYTAPDEYRPTEMSTGLGALKSVQDYMSPYQQAVTDITSREMRRQADIGRQAEQARLAQAGAYGGSRQAIMEAERQRNLQQQMEDITTKGLQSAYDRAMQQRLSESQLGLEAQKGTEASRQYGYGQGMNAAQLAAQYGLEGSRQAEQSRQYGYGQEMTAAQLAAQFGQEAQRAAEQSKQYGYGQGAQAAQLGAQYGLEGAKQTEQSRQFGYGQGMQAAQLGAQYGLEGAKQTEQSRQFGYGQGMQAAQLGAQYGLEGARQSEASRQFGAQLGLQSLNPMLSAASTLGSLGQQQFGAGLQGLQAQMGAGAVQQQLAQQPYDFGYQQFQESVKFPYQQATYMQSLLPGLPLQAAPYQSSEGQSGMFSGLQGALAGLALYNAFNPK